MSWPSRALIVPRYLLRTRDETRAILPFMASRDDPSLIADWLIEEHGADGAKQAALDGVLLAQNVGDNYGLSVWREVRQILAKRSDNTD